MARARVTPEPEPDDGPAPTDTPTEAPEVLPAEAATPPPGRYEFTYPYDVLLADLGRVVGEGDVLDWPDGPPNTSQWQPTKAPITDPRER